MPNDEIKNNNGNGWVKTVLIGLITIALSIGGSVFTTGESTGTQKEKVNQLEARVEKAERLYSNDHDLLITNTEMLKSICQRLTNIEEMLKEMQSRK